MEEAYFCVGIEKKRGAESNAKSHLVLSPVGSDIRQNAAIFDARSVSAIVIGSAFSER
jgi:hypothetical protein